MSDEVKVKSLLKALHILECFTVKEPELGITELSQKLGLNKSNVHNMVSTFEHAGYIEKNTNNNKYHLGLKILELSRVINSRLGLSSIVGPLIRPLSDELGEVIYFAIPKDNLVLYIDDAYPTATLNPRTMLGETAEMYCTSLGKAMLAFMPVDRAMQCLAQQSMKACTLDTITNRKDLLLELEQIRTRGYSIDNMEHEFGIKCVGVPVFNSGGQLIGALSISGPSLRFSEENITKYAAKLTTCARTISLQL